MCMEYIEFNFPADRVKFSAGKGRGLLSSHKGDYIEKKVGLGVIYNKLRYFHIGERAGYGRQRRLKDGLFR